MVAAIKMEPPPEYRPLPEIVPEEAQASQEETPSKGFFNFFTPAPKTVRDVRMEVGPRLEEILQIGNEAENARFYALIQEYSQAFSYDPVLIQDLVIRESKGKNQAISPTGAK